MVLPVKSTFPNEVSGGMASIRMMRGKRRGNVEAELIAYDEADNPSLILGGSEGQTVRLQVNQENGKAELLNEQGKRIWLNQ